MNSSASAINCTKCSKTGRGVLLPVKSDADVWSCGACGAKFSSVTVQKLLININVRLEKVKALAFTAAEVSSLLALQATAM